MNKVAYYGVVKFGDMHMEAAVLDDGRRGFVRTQLAATIGFSERSGRGDRFRRFLEEMSPNTLELYENKAVQVIMSSGQKTVWVDSSILPQIVKDILRANINGVLHPQRKHLVEPCMAIQEALAETGLIALIDEATGYQYRREPDALQKLFARILRLNPMDWERRFHPDYYKSLCGLFGWGYDNHRPLPSVIGQITERWVYGAVFPDEILKEIQTRKGHEKLHQWLSENGGIPLLVKQIDAVALVARGSMDYRDFDDTCTRVFPKSGQQLSILFPFERKKVNPPETVGAVA